MRYAQIDFNNKEIQDIQTGVRTYLERLTTRMNERRRFRISYIQPCGSMEEKSSILKENKRIFARGDIEKYIEFDYLAIHDTPDDIRLDDSCQGCRTSQSCPGCRTSNGPIPKWSLGAHKDFFRLALYCTAAGSCDCFSRRTSNQVLDSYGFDGCPRCIVDMDTGYLQLFGDERMDNDYSLLLLWTSYATSLSDFDCISLQAAQPIKYLAVHIDFLLACKISGEQIDRSYPLFMVPKLCSYCNGTGRLSDCLGEIEYFLKKVSEKHRKSYIILKFLSQFSLIDKYHLKLILFQHCKICSDTSEDYTICVLSILRELSKSYETNVLMSFLGNVNLLVMAGGHIACSGATKEATNHLIKLLSTSNHGLQNLYCRQLSYEIDFLTFN